MDLHEYQAKRLLEKYGIPVPEFEVIASLQELETFLDRAHLPSAVLKVQVHAGGRGKAGGVKFATGRSAIVQAAKELLGKKIVNSQTGPEGKIARQLIISPPVSIKREFYLGMTIDRKLGKSILIASPVGGAEIENTAVEQPDRVLILPFPSDNTFHAYHLIRIAKFMGWEGKIASQGIEIIKAMGLAFIETDAFLLEINPLVETKEEELLSLDAKLTIDDNALFRQTELKNLFDFTQVSPLEERAQKQELAYVVLQGNIGCMVNGAGLAMSTMDLIHYFGGHPANFLDVGGGASKEKVAEGFKIILSDPNVKAILVNIFGGIMNCEIIAEGIIQAAQDLHIHVPLVVRLEGTNVEKGRALLQKSGLNIVTAHDLKEAAQEVVQKASVCQS